MGGEDAAQLPDMAHRALRHPDMSVVIDFSHVSKLEKVEYIYTLLPMLAAIRRTTGLPHRIVVDEAHYFLHEPNIRELLDLNLGRLHAGDLPADRLASGSPQGRGAIDREAHHRSAGDS